MYLSPEIKQQFERLTRQTKDVSERLLLCVILARNKGVSPELIAQAHRISVSSVYQYLNEYEKKIKLKLIQEVGRELTKYC